MVDRQLLASWNAGAAKSAIFDFVARVTKQGGSEFAPPAERVATFDNDGTLCCEQPLQTQFFFAFGRVKELSAKDPTMAERQPFKAVLEHDYNTLFGLGLQALYELAFATHAGITDEEFIEIARGWLATAKHPKVRRAVQRMRLPAAARVARILTGERLQELYRLGRGGPLHAAGP